jgi:hypothetical protein
MNPIYVCFLLVLQACSMAQSPVKQTFAYSRTTIPGIPGENPFPTSYFIYLVIQKGAVISVSGVCLKGNRYEATWRRVASPVVTHRNVSVPTGENDTLVAKTSHDVYQVELGALTGPCSADRTENTLAQRHEVVVCVESAASRWYGLVTKIVPLPPAAAM